MSGWKYFACTLMYSALEIGVSKKKSFSSQDINIAPLPTSEIVLLNRSFDSKRDAAGDDTSSGYSIMSPPTFNMNLYGYDFSWR